MGESIQNQKVLDDIYDRIKRLMKLVLIHIGIILVSLVFVYVISILALLEVEFAEKVSDFVNNKLPVISIISLASLIVSVLYYVAVLDLGRYEYGLLKTGVIGFIYFLFSMITPGSADADAAESIIIKTCIFGLFLYLMFIWSYCDSMRRLSKRVLKRSSESWKEFKTSANVIMAISTVAMVFMLVIVKVLSNFEEFDSSKYDYYSDRFFDEYSRYLEEAEKRTNDILITLLVGLGVLSLCTIILKLYEYRCLKKTLPSEEDDYLAGLENGDV